MADDDINKQSMREMTQAERLAEPFPPEQLKKHPTKGLTYIPIREVVARLNYVLGTAGWNVEIIKLWDAGAVETTTGQYPKWIMAQIRLSGTADALPFYYEGVGGQAVEFLGGKENPTGPVDLGDTYKGAVSDATKKAAQSLGVGLDLGREDDAMHYERALKEADQPKAAPPTLDKIEEMAKALDDAQRADFIHWWAVLTGDGTRGKKISAGQVTLREAAQAVEYLDALPEPAGEKASEPDPEPEPASV